MKLIDIMTSAWAIEPAKLEEITSIYDAHLKREKIDLEALEARIGKPLGSTEQGYNVSDGVAVIPVHGVISKRANMMQKVSGGVSTSLIMRDFEAALEDITVDSILFDIESGGGAVDGTPELARAIFNARGIKPIKAYANGCMASAAYWIGAATDEVIASSTATVGSIGVISQHIDVSERDKKEGIKRTEIFAGKYKRIASDTEPLSEEGKADIQGKVDYLYSLFVADIAEFRGVSEQEVIKNMADGRTFIGKQALDAGLVDGVSTLDAVIEEMASGDLLKNEENDKEIVMAENKDITLESLAESHPEIVEAIRKEGFNAGVQHELERIKAVSDIGLAGHEALIKELMFDGKTTGEQAAVKVLKAEQEKGAAMSANLEKDAAEVNAIEASNGDEPEAKKGFEALVADAEASGLSKADAVRQVATDYPEAHAEYIKGLGE